RAPRADGLRASRARIPARFRGSATPAASAPGEPLADRCRDREDSATESTGRSPEAVCLLVPRLRTSRRGNQTPRAVCALIRTRDPVPLGPAPVSLASPTPLPAPSSLPETSPDEAPCTHTSPLAGPLLLSCLRPFSSASPRPDPCP